jgi:hypothetical protein
MAAKPTAQTADSKAAEQIRGPSYGQHRGRLLSGIWNVLRVTGVESVLLGRV